jgi:hypothetical protein
MKRCVFAMCFAAIGVVALIPADGGATKLGTQVTILIKASGKGFKGEVTAARARCVKDRKVKLQRREPGEDDFTAIGSDRASIDGTWSVRAQPVNRAEYRPVIKAKPGCSPVSTEPTKAHKTSVTLVSGSSSFHGKVSSSSACARDRKVLLREAGFSGPPPTFVTIGSDLTDKGGHWKVDKAPSHKALYRATALAKQANTFTSCMEARSLAERGRRAVP